MSDSDYELETRGNISPGPPPQAEEGIDGFTSWHALSRTEEEIDGSFPCVAGEGYEDGGTRQRRICADSIATPNGNLE